MKFLFLFLVVIISSCKNDKFSKENLKRQHNKSTLSMNGNVKSLSNYIYAFTEKDSSKPLFRSKTVFSFDTSGNLIEEIGFKDYIKQNSESKYKFDEFNNLVEIINNLENSRSITKYIVESNGTILSKTTDESLSSNQVTYTNREYDANFNLVLESRQAANQETVIKEYKYIFDDNGNLIQINISESRLFKNKAIAKNVFTYDNKNRELTRISFLYDDNLTTRNINVYDSNRLTSLTSIDFKGKISKYKFEYDSIGNMTESKRFEEDGSVSGYSETYKYLYDENKNWIQRMEFDVNNKLTLVQKRKIEYY